MFHQQFKTKKIKSGLHRASTSRVTNYLIKSHSRTVRGGVTRIHESLQKLTILH